MTQQQVWLNDHLEAGDQARVSVFDRGFSVGDGVFETLKVTDGAAFALTRHLNRLVQSAHGMGLQIPAVELVRDGVEQLLAANAQVFPELSRLRIQLTAGSGLAGSERSGGEPTLVITQTAATVWPETSAVITVPWTRNEHSPIAGFKTTSYADNVVALARANAVGATEALFANTQGDLCEGTGSNVFVVVGDRLITPPLSSGCLPGITRALVLEWIGAEETAVPMSVLREADEVFITSSTRDISPVHSIDGQLVTHAPGPVTSAAQKVFAMRMSQTLDP